MLPAYNKTYSVYSINARGWLSILCGFHRCKVERAYWTRQTEVWREFSSDRHRPTKTTLENTFWKKTHVEKRHARKNHSRQEPINLSNINTNHIMLKLNCNISTALQFNNKDQMRGVKKRLQIKLGKTHIKSGLFSAQRKYPPVSGGCLPTHASPSRKQGEATSKKWQKT